jgi:hypothetical protein
MIETKPQTITIDPYDGCDPDPETVLAYLLIAIENAYTEGQYKEAIKAKIRDCLKKIDAINSEFLI